MEFIIRDVLTLSDAERRTMEVLGRTLQTNTRLIISVVEATPESAVATDRPRQMLADWTSIYEGLSEDQILQIDRIANNRAQLTRHLPREICLD